MQAVSFSRDSTYRVSVAEEDDAKLWNCVTGTSVKTLEVHAAQDVHVLVHVHNSTYELSCCRLFIYMCLQVMYMYK